MDDYQLSIAVVLALKRPLIRIKQKRISRGYLLREETFRKIILCHGFLETSDVQKIILKPYNYPKAL